MSDNRQAIAQKKYRSSSKGREKRRLCQLAYRKTDKGKDVQKSYAKSEKAQDYRAAYRKSERARALAIGVDPDFVPARPSVCVVCVIPSNRTLTIDHDHSTGMFRGWLCTHCNSALGHARDNPDVLVKLAEYVRATRT